MESNKLITKKAMPSVPSPAGVSILGGLFLLLILTPCIVGSVDGEVQSNTLSRRATFNHMANLISNLLTCLEKEADPANKDKDCFKKGLLTDVEGLMKLAYDTETENLSLRVELDTLRKSQSESQVNPVEGDTQAIQIELEACQDQVKALQNGTNLDSELFLAAHNKNEAAVRALVGLGAAVNGRNNRSETPLHRAAVRANKAFGVKIIKYLIENGADPYVRDNEDYTFLDTLVQDGTTLTPTQFHELVSFLMARDGAQLFNSFGNFSIKFETPRFHRNCQKNTPLMMAVKNLEMKAKTLSLLQNGGVDFDAVNTHGGSLLLYAMVGKRSTQFMSELVALGVDPKHRDIAGQNLLHEAAKFGGVEELKFVLDLGIQVSSVDRAGDTPLHDLFLYGFYNMVDRTSFLIDNGADTKVKNNEGKTAYDIALSRNDLLEKAKLLQMLVVSQ